MPTVAYKLLDKYHVDRADGMSALGPEKLVILILQPNGGPPEHYAISKMDAMLIGLALQGAATDMQDKS